MAMGTFSRLAALGCWSNSAGLVNWAYLDLLVSVIFSYLYTIIISTETVLAELFGAYGTHTLVYAAFRSQRAAACHFVGTIIYLPPSNYLL